MLDMSVWKTSTNEEKIKYIDYLKTASHSVLKTFQTT